MATIPFENVYGKSVSEIEKLISEKWEHWHKVNFDPLIRVYANLDQYPKQYKAILACDNDGIVQYTYVIRKDGDKWKSIYLYNGFYQHIHSTNDIVTLYEVEKRIEKRLGKLPQYMQFEKKIAVREALKRIARYKTDRLSVPTCNDKQIWRTVADSDGMDGTDYIIIPDNGETDDDIEEFVRDTVFCGWGDLLIDCTGKKCTTGWSARKVPCGIAITHDWVYDY